MTIRHVTRAVLAVGLTAGTLYAVILGDVTGEAIGLLGSLSGMALTFYFKREEE